RFEVGKPAADPALALHVLQRVRRVNGNRALAWRAQGRFESADPRAIDRQRNEDVRVAERVVVEEVLRIGPKRGQVGRPAVEGNGQAHLVLSVTLALERQKPEALLRGELLQRARDGRQWRRLVVATDERTYRPLSRQLDRDADAGVHCSLADLSG